MTEFEKWLESQDPEEMLKRMDTVPMDTKLFMYGFNSGLRDKPLPSMLPFGRFGEANYPIDARGVATAAGRAPKNMGPMSRGSDYDMSSVDALKDQDIAHKEMKAANSLEAERNEASGWLTSAESHLAQLETAIKDYDKEIARLQTEIRMSEAGDPMYKLAVMRMIMDNDNSLMSDIRSRINKDIDQRFQMSQKKADQDFQHQENELNRKNTLDVAKMNKAEQEAAKKQDLENAFNSTAMMYDWAKKDLADNPTDKKLQRSVEKAKQLYLEAAKKAGKDVHFEVSEATVNPDLTEIFKDYEVEGMDGIKAYLETLKKSNPKAYERELKNLKARGITEKDLGLTGAEEKIITDKNKKAAAQKTKIEKAKALKFDDEPSATAKLKELGLNGVMTVGYKEGQYILKEKK